jgi:hypothetical protein
MTRGRMLERRIGATQRFNFGRGRIDEQIVAPEPVLFAGPQTTDRCASARRPRL